jgi:hypothetical protein
MGTVLGYSNKIDSATLSGGSWNAGYPLSNLKNRYLAQKARTTNALSTSSIIDIDLGSAQVIGVVAVVAHNLSAAATVRIQGDDTAGITSPLYDSGALPIYSGSDYALPFAPVSARYWRISLIDTGNAAGYIQLGRVFIGPKLAPAKGTDWGQSLAIDSSTEVQRSLGGPEYFDERANRRIWRGKWSWLTDAEGYSTVLGILRSHDISREVYVIGDDADTTYRGERNFLGRLRQLNAIEWPYLNYHAMAAEIGELI